VVGVLGGEGVLVPPPLVPPAGGVVGDGDGDGLLEPLVSLFRPLHAARVNATASVSVTKGMRRMWVLLYSSVPSISGLRRAGRILQSGPATTNAGRLKKFNAEPRFFY
jgi:hypothetical protein